MTWRYLDDNDVTTLSDSKVADLFEEEGLGFVFDLHREWRLCWQGRTAQVAEKEAARAYLERRTSELTAQVEALKEELYEVSRRAL